MMNQRHGNTGIEMVASGSWVKVGRKHYRHVSGAEVVYDCNRWHWQVTGAGSWDGLYGSLWVARHYAEKGAAA